MFLKEMLLLLKLSNPLSTRSSDMDNRWGSFPYKGNLSGFHRINDCIQKDTQEFLVDKSKDSYNTRPGQNFHMRHNSDHFRSHGKRKFPPDNLYRLHTEQLNWSKGKLNPALTPRRTAIKARAVVNTLRRFLEQGQKYNQGF